MASQASQEWMRADYTAGKDGMPVTFHAVPGWATPEFGVRNDSRAFQRQTLPAPPRKGESSLPGKTGCMKHRVLQ